ncbi:MAG: SUMF1/EgtB/PvdO family nonheme iron enzyme [Anaerolineales bacterium]|nr:SUMF1/EgtB/PvdO family nonheme iron enzyme [Anaerolineales bacterium]
MKKINLLFLVTFILSACQAETPIPTPEPTFTNIPQATQTPEPATTEIPPSPTMIPTAEPEIVKISTKDGMTQIYIPEGKFMMGGLDVYRENDELPPHEVTLNEFWIDQVEVTNGMYNLCVQSGDCRPPAQIRSNRREEYFGNIEFQDYPVVNVTWYDANTYCQWAGRRLPTEAEWEYAARGSDKRNYPWGDEPPNEYTANFLNLVGDTSRVGSYAEGTSPFGVLDMAGNVWEWVSDRYRMDYYAKSPTENPTGPSVDEVFNNMFVIRGGSFQDEELDLRVSNRNYIEGPNPRAQTNEDEFYGKFSVKIGFRCVVSE